jgi:hypothetical protein
MQALSALNVLLSLCHQPPHRVQLIPVVLSFAVEAVSLSTALESLHDAPPADPAPATDARAIQAAAQQDDPVDPTGDHLDLAPEIDDPTGDHLDLAPEIDDPSDRAQPAAVPASIVSSPAVAPMAPLAMVDSLVDPSPFAHTSPY